jgi:hypothetical protein
MLTSKWKAIGTVTVMTVSLFATPSWAGDTLKLRSLQLSPESYTSRTVRVAGRVTSHRIRVTNTEKCIHRFTIMDDTGTMQAIYMAACPGGASYLRNGDRVMLDVRLEKDRGEKRLLKVRSVVAKIDH